MFENIGKKLMVAGRVLFCLGIVFAAFILLGAWAESANYVNPFVIQLAGLLVSALTFLGMWFFSLLVYGFGRLIENSDKLVMIDEEIVNNQGEEELNNKKEG